MSRRREVPPDLLQAFTPHILRLANGSGSAGVAHTDYTPASRMIATANGISGGTALTNDMVLRLNAAPVFLTTPGTSSSWNASAYSTGSGTIDMSATFGVPGSIVAAWVQIQARDSGSGTATDLYVGLGPTLATSYAVAARCHGLPNDSYASATGLVPCNADGDLVYAIKASDTNATDVWLRILGYWTP